MSIWPFRRKSQRKKNLSKSATDPITAMQRSGSGRSIGRQNGSQTDVSGLARKRTGREKHRQQSREGKKLVRDPARRTYSFSPGRKESLAVPKDIHHQYPVPPIPDNAASMPGKSAGGNPRTGTSHGAAEDDAVGRAPTLHKRSAQDLLHRKSSKKRKEDHERLAELKAMNKEARSSTTPDPSRTDTVKPKGIKRIFTNHAHHASRSSNISLPPHNSLGSSHSSDAEGATSYILKGIDMFSPRPTIRYAQHPQMKHQSSPHLDKIPADSRADAFDKEKSRKRIEELADELDAHDLRELMDRDRRRRERKKQHDQEKMERKLARRARKQEAAVRKALENGEEPPKNMERGVMGRELTGLGIDTSDVPAPLVPRKNSSKLVRRDSATSSKYSEHIIGEKQETAAQSPDTFMRNPSLPGTEPTSPMDDREEPVIQIAQIARLSRANMSPPPSPKQVRDHKRESSNVSQLKDLPSAPILSDPSTPIEPPKIQQTPGQMQKPEAFRRSSDGSSYQRSSWKSWFQRTSKDRRSSTQSSFSNTTRESIIASSQPQQPPITFVQPIVANSNLPKRTMSRFREDLPELPISPPASRVQSPEAQPIPGAIPMDAHREHIGRALSDSPSDLRRYDSPLSFNRQAEQGSSLRYETPVNGDRTADAPSPEPINIMSQSLASIDSEGSWLSGRPRSDSKRSSAQRSSQRSSRQEQNLSRQSYNSLQQRRYIPEHLEDGEEITLDEYYSRLTPDMYNKTKEQSRISGNPMPSSDEDDNNERMPTPRSAVPKTNEGTWGEVARRPTVIQRVQRTHSAQGVLNNYADESDEDDHGHEYRPRTPENREYDNSEFEGSPSSPGELLQRATSIDYKKNHIRHISAGSARLLDLKPKASADAKRKSVGF